MWLGNLILLVVVNLPLTGLWVSLLWVPYRLLYPAVVLFCCVGAYFLKASGFDILLLGVLGILLSSGEAGPARHPAPAGFRPRAADGNHPSPHADDLCWDFGGFMQSPIALALLCTTAGIVIYALLPRSPRKATECPRHLPVRGSSVALGSMGAECHPRLVVLQERRTSSSPPPPRKQCSALRPFD